MNYIQENWVEIVGSILSLIYLYLSVKQRISLWIFGFLCSALYAVVFFQSQFYAGMTLQFYYLFISVYGWINWKRGKENSDKELPVSRVPKKIIAYLASASVLIFFLYYFVHSKTDSSLLVAVGDSFVTSLSIIATWMLAKKYIEYWLVFIVVNPVSASLFFHQNLYPTAILFLVYTTIAVIGYFQWKKSLQK